MTWTVPSASSLCKTDVSCRTVSIHACTYMLPNRSCLNCILVWTRTQRGPKTCPLCKAPIGPHVLHALDPTTHRFLMHALSEDEEPPETDDTTDLHHPSLRESPNEEPRPSLQDMRRQEETRHRRNMRQSLLTRRRIYRYHLYAKHVASNRYTKYKPYPGPTGFRRNAAYARLLSTFLQRELQVWPHLDVPFLSYYIPAMLSYVDITSDAMLECLSEWIGDANDARHLAHEMELFVRSGLGGLGLDQYDRNPWLQYDAVTSN